MLIEEWLDVSVLFGSVAIDLAVAEDGVVTITHIGSLAKGQRDAAVEALGTLCLLADTNQVRLFAESDPVTGTDEERSRLKSCLMHFGFTPAHHAPDRKYVRTPEYLG